MKKRFALFLSLVMVLSSVIPVCTFAAEDNGASRDEIIALASDVFPEYRDKIQGSAPTPCISPRTSGEDDAVVCSVTRQVSDTEELTYVETRAGGTFLIRSTQNDLITGSATGSSSSVSGGKFYTKTITIISPNENYAGEVTLNRVQFTIYDSAYDIINSKGTYSANRYAIVTPDSSPKYAEDASGDATYKYTIVFTLGEDGHPRYNIGFTVTLRVGGNFAVVDINV